MAINWVSTARTIVLVLCVTSFVDKGKGDDVSSMASAHVRTNWGVVFNKVGTVLNGITKYRHTFGITIPVLDYLPLETMRCNSASLKLAHCETINDLIAQVNGKYQGDFDLMKKNVGNILAVIGNVEAADVKGRKLNPGKRRKRRSAGQQLQQEEPVGTPHLSPNYCKDEAVEGGNNGGGFLATLGKIGSDIFGLPTYDDIKIVDRHICELADSVDLNRREILKSNERLSSISATLNNRISALQHGLVNMNARITETQENLMEVAKTVVNDLNELKKRMNYIEVTQEAMYLFMANLERFKNAALQHLRYAETWLFGVNRLLEGYVPQELVSVDDIQSVLDHVNTDVLPRYPGLRMVHTNPSFYYQVRSTAFTRSNHYVFITLTVPLKSDGGVLGVYRIDRTHIPTAEHHTSSTRIANLPDFIAVTPDLAYYTEMSVAHYTSCRGEGIKVCPTERALQDSNRLTCAASIFFDKKADIVDKCDIRYEPGDVASEAIRLGDAEYLVHSEKASRESTWTLHCPYARPEEGQSDIEPMKSIPSCNTCIVRVPCGCSLDGGTFLIPLQLTGCAIAEHPGFPEVTKVYPVNLPVLTSIYSVGDIANVNGSTTHGDVSDGNPLALSKLMINYTKSNWEEVVAKDEKYKTDFKRLMAQQKKGMVTYGDRAEYYLRKATDFKDLNMAHIKDLEAQFGGELYKEFLNPRAMVGGISVFWMVAISTLAMTLYNCCKGRTR